MAIILTTIVYVIISLFLIIVVLLQSGKAADLAGAFGGMGSQTAFGPRGSATLLSKATTVAAVLFMLISISLGIMKTRNRGSDESVIERTGTTGEPAPETLEPGTDLIPFHDSSTPSIGIRARGGNRGWRGWGAAIGIRAS